MKEKLLNSTIQEVFDYIKEMKKQGYTIEDIKRIIEE